MRTNRVVKWGIVLLLLAALPGMTAVLAQEQEPAQTAPVAIERGESAAAIPVKFWETESNDSIADANRLFEYAYTPGPFSVGGVIGRAGDVDYYELPHWVAEYWEPYADTNAAVLLDLEAYSLGSPLDAVICLYAADATELACSNNTDTPDPMLYYNLNSDYRASHYIAVRANSGSSGGSGYSYQLLISSPLLVSAAAGNLGTGTVAGIPFQAGDILAWSVFHDESGQGWVEKWVMLFDLSDLNVKGNVSNLAGGWRNSDFLLLGFAANVRLPGISQVITPWDVVVFDPTQVGPRTEGVFRSWWAGRSQGLTTTAEKIDAIDWPNWWGYTRLYVSTTGTAAVYRGPANTLRLPDEDIGLWTDDPDSPFGTMWERFVDSSTIPGLGTEDVVAFSSLELWDYEYVEIEGAWHMVLQGTARCGTTPMTLTQKDIAVILWDWNPDGDGLVWRCNRWRGPDHGWNYNIDAIEFNDWAGYTIQ